MVRRTYKELTRRYHLRSVIWLHDGLWIPTEVPVDIILTAEQSMLHLLQLERTAVFRIQDLAVEANEITERFHDIRHVTGALYTRRRYTKRDLV